MNLEMIIKETLPVIKNMIWNNKEIIGFVIHYCLSVKYIQHVTRRDKPM